MDVKKLKAKLEKVSDDLEIIIQTPSGEKFDISFVNKRNLSCGHTFRTVFWIVCKKDAKSIR